MENKEARRRIRQLFDGLSAGINIGVPSNAERMIALRKLEEAQYYAMRALGWDFDESSSTKPVEDQHLDVFGNPKS